MREVFIVGAGGHARSVADVLLAANQDLSLLFVDQQARPNERIFGFPVVFPDDVDLSQPGIECFVAIGDNYERSRTREALGAAASMSVIAEDARIARDVSIGEGVFVGHDAYIGPLAKIGDGTIVNTRAIVEHEVVLGEHIHVAPGAIVGGRTTVGDYSFIALGAHVINRLSVTRDVTVGASATVVRDIATPGTYVGIPARRVEPRA